MNLVNKSDSILLSVETATRGGSLAILTGEKALAVWQGGGDFSASNNLLANVSGLLEKAGLRIEQLTNLAVARGPGSFTGLRVGIAVCQGLAAALQIPLRGVPTLPAMAVDCSGAKIVCALIPAGRGEVFAQTFDFDRSKLRVLGHVASAPINQTLSELQNYPDVTLIVNHELFAAVTEYIQEKSLTHWQARQFSSNLAFNIGQMALKPIGDLQDYQTLKAIYGRGADIGKNKTGEQK